MILYRLRCAGAHEFEGWFQSSGGFDRQCEAGFVSCPSCGSTSVTRALMAPSVLAADRRERPASRPDASPDEARGPAEGAATGGGRPPPGPRGPGSRSGAGLPDEVRAALARVRATVERDCDYVGEDFAAEARRMHRGETDPRGIYGEATESERDALAEEGVEVHRIPWVPRIDG